MSFPLAYPLGGSPLRRRLLWEAEIKQRVPPWLRRTVGGAIMKAVGMCVDSMIDRAAAGVKLRFPNSGNVDALAIIGRERRIVRGPAESADAYALRVQDWLSAHQRRGSVYAMLGQWDAYNTGDKRLIEVLYQSGTLYLLYPTGTIERAIVPWQHPPEGGWAQAWIQIHYDSDPSLTADDEAVLALIPRLWSSAHMVLHVYAVWPGARLWGYPEPTLTWDEQAALYTWDDLVPHEVI